MVDSSAQTKRGGLDQASPRPVDSLHFSLHTRNKGNHTWYLICELEASSALRSVSLLAQLRSLMVLVTDIRGDLRPLGDLMSCTAGLRFLAGAAV